MTKQIEKTNALSIVAEQANAERSNSRAQVFAAIEELARAEGQGDLSKPRLVWQVADATLAGTFKVTNDKDNDDAAQAWRVYAEVKRGAASDIVGDLTADTKDLNSERANQARASELRNVIAATAAIGDDMLDRVQRDDAGQPVLDDANLPVTIHGLYERAVRIIAGNPGMRKGSVYQNLIAVMRAQKALVDGKFVHNGQAVPADKRPLSDEEIEGVVFPSKADRIKDELEQIKAMLKAAIKCRDGRRADPEKNITEIPGFPSPELTRVINNLEARMAEIEVALADEKKAALNLVLDAKREAAAA